MIFHTVLFENGNLYTECHVVQVASPFDPNDIEAGLVAMQQVLMRCGAPMDVFKALYTHGEVHLVMNSNVAIVENGTLTIQPTHKIKRFSLPVYSDMFGDRPYRFSSEKLEELNLDALAWQVLAPVSVQDPRSWKFWKPVTYNTKYQVKTETAHYRLSKWGGHKIYLPLKEVLKYQDTVFHVTAPLIKVYGTSIHTENPLIIGDQ